MRGGSVRLCPNIDVAANMMASGRIPADVMCASRSVRLT
jgi:hypothetical protein